jgi:hypothetical protein
MPKIKYYSLWNVYGRKGKGRWVKLGKESTRSAALRRKKLLESPGSWKMQVRVKQEKHVSLKKSTF